MADIKSGQIKDIFLMTGFNTSVTWTHKNHQGGLISHASFSNRGNLNLSIGNVHVQGRGRLRQVSFAPFYKYFLDENYLMIGPLWKVMTFKMHRYETLSGTFTKRYKMMFASRGFFISIGREEVSSKKHPLFWNIHYSFVEGKRGWLADVPNLKDATTLATQKDLQFPKAHSILISMGILIF